MDCCVFYNRIPIPIVGALPTAVKPEVGFKLFSHLRSSDSSLNFSFGFQRAIRPCETRRLRGRINCGDRRRLRTVLVAAANAESSHCEYRSLDRPLEPTSSAGKFLSGILQNHRHFFHFAVAEQLKELAADRDGAIARKKLSQGSAESCLHRRIAELKEYGCQIAIEDVMYMLIVHKFTEIKVPMVPRLSRCISNRGLEIWPSKDRELESIHSFEVLEMVREHIATILDWRGKSRVTKNCTTTQIHRLQLGRVYAASVMYGYFLKSACLRHQLELHLALTHKDLPHGDGIRLPLAEFQPHGLENFFILDALSDRRSTSLCQVSGKHENLKGYVMGFDPETLQRCAKLKSQEAVNLIERHSWALFGDEKTGGLDSEEVITVTLSSLKRLVLEAVAFGSFLWDVEGYVDNVYGLKES